MTNRQLLMYFKQHINYFDNVRESDFDVLIKLDNDLFPFCIEENYIITPLLKQISEYSLILDAFPEELIEYTQEEPFKDILEFVTNCRYYISRLISIGYLHPSVILNTYINNICVLFEDMYETAYKISGSTILTSEKSNMDVGNLIAYFDELSNTVYDNICDGFDESLNGLTNDNMINKKDLLLLLKNYSTHVFKGLALFNSVNQYTAESKNIVFTNSGNETLYLFDVISLANSLKEKIQDPILVALINKLLDEYKLYSSFRYQYLRMHHNEQVYLQKYKKYQS